ncbi:MAG: hypothetical protein FJ403_20600 [Verrucomicrobia bacterium]|nr:hypothetical protein [Verrucomicrobiota bacterium]
MNSVGVLLSIYIVLLLAGGLIGFLKAGSKASLIASLISAILLGLFQFVIPGAGYAADIVLGALLIFFGMRFVKGKKFMPAGLMTVVTLVTLILRFVI